MPSSLLDLPPELRLQVYDYFHPAVMGLGNAEDLLNAQRLRATSPRIREELDEELQKRIRLAMKASMGNQDYEVVVSNKGSKPKVRFNIPLSFMKAEYKTDWDPRTSFSYRLMTSTPPYIQACFFKLVHDINVTPSDASRYAGRIIAGRVFFVLDNPGLPVGRSVSLLDWTGIASTGRTL